MLIRYNPKVEHLKCVILTPKEDEWKAMRGNIQAELDSGEIKLLAQKLDNGTNAKNLKEMSVANAVRYVNECNSPDTLKKWYNEITKEEVRLAITKKMQKLGVEPPEDKIPDDEDDDGVSVDDEDEEDKKPAKGNPAADDEDEGLSEADLATKTVDELKSLCEKKGIDTKKITKKSDLVEALMGAKD